MVGKNVNRQQPSRFSKLSISHGNVRKVPRRHERTGFPLQYEKYFSKILNQVNISSRLVHRNWRWYPGVTVVAESEFEVRRPHLRPSQDQTIKNLKNYSFEVAEYKFEVSQPHSRLIGDQTVKKTFKNSWTGRRIRIRCLFVLCMHHRGHSRSSYGRYFSSVIQLCIS